MIREGLSELQEEELSCRLRRLVEPPLSYPKSLSYRPICTSFNLRLSASSYGTFVFHDRNLPA